LSRAAWGFRGWIRDAPRSVAAQSGRGLSSGLGNYKSGRKTRSIQEQLAAQKARQSPDAGAAHPDEPTAAAGGIAMPRQGTLTLAERLSQSLKDPLRAVGFLGTVTKGETEIHCHETCKVVWIRNRKAIVDTETLGHLAEVIEISDSNWYDKFTVFRGDEDNFCRGLDVRSLHGFGKPRAGSHAEQMPVLESLFRLSYLISRSPKTRIAVIDGMSLGAGASLAVCHLNVDGGAHGARNFSIASTRTVFSIQASHFLGMFPLCGASYFLPRLRGSLGTYLALSGSRLNAADVMHAGLATHFMPPDRLEKCMAELSGRAQNDGEFGAAQIEEVLGRYATSATSTKEFKAFDPSNPPSYLMRYAGESFTDPTHLEANSEAIDRCFGKSNVDEMLAALEEEESAWAQNTLANIRQMSPTSLRVTFELLRRGATQSLEDCIRTEWRLARRLFARDDFHEGVRAFEIDRDGAPKWDPAPTKEEVSSLFRPMGEAELMPLELSQRHLQKGHQKISKGEIRV